MTERVYNVHVSELNSRFNEEPNVVLNDTFWFDTTTERANQWEIEYELDEW